MKKAEKPVGKFIEPLLTRPERVAIVALGPSCRSFVQESMSNRGMKSHFDEVWTVNRGFNAFVHDKLFVMDDLKWLETHNADYAKFLTRHDKPIITSTVYDKYPMAVEYPVMEVMETIQDDVFAVNTVAYMVAYAIHIRVKEVYIYGADFVYPSGDTSEFGGQAVAYLCGMMRQFDMVHIIPGDSTLLYANKVKVKSNGQQGRELYGFHRITAMQEEEAKRKKMLAARNASRKGK